MTTKIKEFTQYRRKQIAELRPYIEGEDVSRISISQEDAKAGSPKRGDMIARNPKNHADQWLVAHAYFLDNFEPLSTEQTETAPPINVKFETSENGITGTKLVDVKRVEHEDDGSLTVVIDYWPEPASATRSGAVKVKPLVWEHHPAGLVASTNGIGEVYIIDTRTVHRVYFLKGMNSNREYPSVEAAKAAAQADYERRILSALEFTEPTSSSLYYPVPMPLDADGRGPASFEKGEVRKLVFEVWDQDFRTHGTFDSLLEAIAHANRLNDPTTCAKLEADRYEKRIAELEARKSSLTRLLSLIVDFAAEWKETLQWIDRELMDRGISQSDPIRIKIQDALLMPENATKLAEMLAERDALVAENERLWVE